MSYSKELSDYQANGYCKIESFFSKSEIDQVVSKIDAFIEGKVSDLSGRDVNWVEGRLNSIHCLHREDPFFANFAKSEKLVALVNLILQEECELRGAELFAKPAKVGLPSPYHQDNYYWCVAGANALTVWVALDDCDETNGGITYFNGTHKLGLLDHIDSNAPGSSQTIADKALLDQLASTKVCPSVKRGDCLIHHSLTIHGSAANQSDKSRRGFTMQFKAKSAVYDEKMKQHYESRLRSQVELRQKQNENVTL